MLNKLDLLENIPFKPLPQYSNFVSFTVKEPYSMGKFLETLHLAAMVANDDDGTKSSSSGNVGVFECKTSEDDSDNDGGS